MPSEGVLLESRTMRDDYAGRVEVLDKVKAVKLLPDGIHLRTEDVARYFEIHRKAVGKAVERHRGELTDNGLRVLRGADLRLFQSDLRSLCKPEDGESYPQAATQQTLFTRRTVLNLAMLLRSSDIARRVRSSLLDAEERSRSAPVSDPALEARVAATESLIDRVGQSLSELGPVLNRMSERIEGLDSRLAATNSVVCAMSSRLADLDTRVSKVEQRTDLVLDLLTSRSRWRR